MTKNACNNENDKFGENSRMSEGAPWKVTSDEKGKLGKRINLAKTERWCLKGSLERWWFWRKMANLTKMTNSPFWSHRRVYYFRQNRHYWRGAFEHLIRSSVTSLANFAKFATFKGPLCYLIWHVVEGLTNFCHIRHFRQIRHIRQNRHFQ